MVWHGLYQPSRGVLGATVVITLLVVTSILWWEKHTRTTQGKRDLTQQKELDYCLSKHGGLELNYVKGTNITYQFDLCDVISCGKGNNCGWGEYDAYLCPDPLVNLDCRQKDTGSGSGSWCGNWGQVSHWTGQGWSPPGWGLTRTAQRKILFTKGQLRWKEGGKYNPLLLSIVNLEDQDISPGRSGRHYLMGKGVCTELATCTNSTLYFVLGVDRAGTDAMGLIKLNLWNPPQGTQTGNSQLRANSSQEVLREGTSPEVISIDYNKITHRDLVKLATGYDEKNVWLDWLTKTAKEQGMEDCVACASARPHLFTTPAPLYPGNDTWGYGCMLKLTKESTPVNYTTLASIYPPISNKTVVGGFRPNAGQRNYTCFNFTTSHSSPIFLGTINRTWCSRTVHDSHTLIGPWARGGLYWYCGAHRLFVRIPQKGVGICAMVRLDVPLTLIGTRGMVSVGVGQLHLGSSLTNRRRRHVISRRAVSSFDLSLNSPTYIDAIGVPGGVPDEYKLADQIAAGFENIPIVSAFFPVTPNKNVDRINYVHYNVLRLANLTRDAVEGLSEQLAPTSLMAVQNRMVLDMLLAKEGGVCSMFGEMCCTFIPNNTAPDGSVTRALEGLHTLSKTMHEHSGIDNPIDTWFNRMFGKWKGVIVSVLITVVTVITVLITCGCCCVPCIRSLCNRLITTAIEGRDRDMNPKQMMPLLEQDKGVDECEKLSAYTENEV